jgi:hypothetical protein
MPNEPTRNDQTAFEVLNRNSDRPELLERPAQISRIIITPLNRNHNQLQNEQSNEASTSVTDERKDWPRFCKTNSKDCSVCPVKDLKKLVKNQSKQGEVLAELKRHMHPTSKQVSGKYLSVVEQIQVIEEHNKKFHPIEFTALNQNEPGEF